MIAVMRFTGTSIWRASSAALIPSSLSSSARCSPGWIGVRATRVSLSPASVRRYRGWRAFVFDKEREDLGRRRRARVLRDDVDVVRLFIERVSGLQRDLLAALDLHDKGALEHVDEHVCIVPMGR